MSKKLMGSLWQEVPHLSDLPVDDSSINDFLVARSHRMWL